MGLAPSKWEFCLELFADDEEEVSDPRTLRANFNPRTFGQDGVNVFGIDWIEADAADVARRELKRTTVNANTMARRNMLAAQP